MGEKAGERELLREYESLWVNEGFLSREHEELRKKAGREALRRFCRREEESGQTPSFLEKSFKWQREKIKFIGRWDRIDIREGEAVIIDFKATEVKDQKEADKRTAESLQMDLYALSFCRTQDTPLRRDPAPFSGIGPHRPGEKGREGDGKGLGEDQGGRTGDPEPGFPGPARFPQLFLLRVQDHLPLHLRLLR